MKPEGLSYGDRAASEGQVMKLYHTGEAEIRTPDIRRGRESLEADVVIGRIAISGEAVPVAESTILAEL